MEEKSFFYKHWQILIFIASIIFCFVSIQKGHNFGDDFALYIEQGFAILNNSTNEVFETNKFAMENSSKAVGPFLYPQGLPVLIAPILFFFGLNFVTLKIFCAIFLFASFLLMLRFIKQLLPSKNLQIIAFIFLAFNYNFYYLADALRSDFPYLFFSLLALIFLHAKEKGINYFILGVLIFVSYFIRDVGITLLATLVFYWFFSCFFNGKKSILKLIIPIVTFTILLIVSKFIFPQKGSSNHYDMLFSINFKTIINQVLYNVKQIVQIFGEPYSSDLFVYILAIFVLPLFLIGLIKINKKDFVFVFYILINLFILFLWPANQGFRFLIPISVFIIIYILRGADFVFSFLKNRKLKQSLSFTILAIFAIFHTSLIVKSTFKKTDQVETTEMKQIYKYIKSNIKKEEIIAFKKPRALRLFAGNNTIFIKDLNIKNTVANYILLDNSKKTNKNILQYVKLKEFENYTLYKK